MRNLLFTIRYQGTNYHGFQVQKNALTVAEVLQNALHSVTGIHEDIKGCSRTDSGVHSNQFCVSMKTTCTIPCKNFIKALNIHLPYDIAVTDCVEVPIDFHARYSCKGKRYIYKIHDNIIRDPFLHNLVLEWRYPLNEHFLSDQCVDFVGTHDFSAFCAANGSVVDKVRTITNCTIQRNDNLIVFSVEGDGFLYNMVRIMVGTLLELSAGSIPAGTIPAILELKKRDRAGITVAPQGLYLDKVFY